MAGNRAPNWVNEMMEISRGADYAVRAVLELGAANGDARLSSAEIAERQEIAAPFLTKILTRLASAGIVSTYRGANGGVVLARAAAEISLLEVVEAIEGPNLAQPLPAVSRLVPARL